MGKVSLATVIEELNLPFIENLAPDDYPRFDGVRMLNRIESRPKDTYLYVALFSEYMEFCINHRNRGITCICLADRIVKQDAVDSYQNMFLVEDNINLPELFNKVQDIFDKINNWENALKDSVLANKGIQDLLDISEPITKNHISVMDNTFALIAHSRQTECDDPVVVEFVNRGYHPDEMIQKLTRLGHIAFYKKSNDIYVDNSYQISKYIGLEKAFSFNGTFTIQVIMNCNVKYSPNIYILFKTLIDYIGYYVNPDEVTAMRIAHDTSAVTILRDMLKGDKTIPENELISRTRRAGLAASGIYNVYTAVFMDEENLPVHRIFQEIQTILGTSSYSFLDDGHIIILNQFLKDSCRSQNEFRQQSLEALFAENHIAGGVSSFFTHISQFPVAQKQSMLAANMIRQQSVSIPTEKVSSFLKYESAVLFDISRKYYLENGPMIQLTTAYQCLEIIKDYDRKHNLNNLFLLRCYLAFDCNASKAATICHMHKNNALYHINKIRDDVMGEQFDDPLFREQLMMLLKIEEFNILC